MRTEWCVLWTLGLACTLAAACPCPPGTHCPGEGEQGCINCPTGTYQDTQTSGIFCIDCRISCGKREVKKEDCSAISNMICECMKGYFKPAGHNGLCLPHKPCPPGQGVKTAGTPYNDTVCEVCGPDKFSPDESATQICSPCLSCVDGEEEERECNSYTDRVCKPKGKKMAIGAIVGIIGGSLIGLIILAAIFVFLYRKGKFPCIVRNKDDPDSNRDIKFIPVNGRDSDRVSSTLPTAAVNGSLPPGMTNSPGSEILRVQIPPDSPPYSLPSVHSGNSAISNNGTTYNRSYSQDGSWSGETSPGSGFPLRRVFIDLSQDLCQVEWEMFFRRLRGEGCDAVLAKVKIDHHGSVREQIYQMLLEWQRTKPGEATLDALVEELEDMSENLLASKYKEYKEKHVLVS